MPDLSMSRAACNAYRDDLAFIHDAGFGDMSRDAAKTLLKLLGRRHFASARIVDLGCGAGVLASAMCDAGYDVLGYDISPAMVRRARKRAPEADLRCAPLLSVRLPRCAAVCAIGEVFNYLFDQRTNQQQLNKMFARIYQALEPGGWLLFDVALVGRVPGGVRRSFVEGDGWTCLVESVEDRASRMLERRITSFRKLGRHFRRSEEVHRLRLFRRDELQAMLRTAGFRVRTVKGWGATKLPRGYVGFVCVKP
jgi:SAM-dependent methyltransferase